jgi:uncharacterized protein YyaL (SSP411 family)
MEKADDQNGCRPNHLIGEKSPYLLQHARNPVEWYPWGEEAFQKAREEDRPIFLSIGYATCHWCHVMAHESFEDEQVAELLNQSFVSIKVDREERPDIDQIYMAVCQALTGQGGWPLTIFMTPTGDPFFAGTYFPKTGRMGMAGFTDLAARISTLWQTDRQRLLQGGEQIRQALQREPSFPVSPTVSIAEILRGGYAQLNRTFDEEWGGFGTAPKFPTPHHLTFLLRWQRRGGEAQAGRMVEKTLDCMRRGGMFDQVGFGFHRYSVDEKWLVPHFEKMLYDQALLAIAYTEAYQALRRPDFAEVVREIFTYVLRDMTAAEGCFYSAEDADSEGHEGLFYLWTPQEVKKILGNDRGERICRFFGILPEGNFEEGRSILHLPVPVESFARGEKMEVEEWKTLLRGARETLWRARERRSHPLKDDKVITSWNGLMIAALAKGYQALQDLEFLQAAARAADFFLGKMCSTTERLYRRFRQGDVAIEGFLEDYAFFVWGLIELYEAGSEIRYIEKAVHLTQAMIDLFWDSRGAGFFFSGKGNESLITRPKELYDGAIPSGNSVGALNLLRLGRMTGNGDWEKKADKMVSFFSSQVREAPLAYSQFLIFLDFVLGPAREIVIAGDPAWESSQAMIRKVHQSFLPNKVLLFRPDGPKGEKLAELSPFVQSMHSSGGKATAYVCEGFRCQTPITEIRDLVSALS